jgi:hypothetical protein
MISELNKRYGVLLLPLPEVGAPLKVKTKRTWGQLRQCDICGSVICDILKAGGRIINPPGVVRELRTCGGCDLHRTFLSNRHYDLLL